jgi:hypothetical protein
LTSAETISGWAPAARDRPSNTSARAVDGGLAAEGPEQGLVGEVFDEVDGVDRLQGGEAEGDVAHSLGQQAFGLRLGEGRHPAMLGDVAQLRPITVDGAGHR